METTVDRLEPEGFASEELGRLRLESLEIVLLVLYAAVIALVLAPIDPTLRGAGWLGIGVGLVLVGAFFLRTWSLRVAGAFLAVSLFGVWAVALLLFPGPAVVWSAAIVVGVASALFGPRATFLTAGLLGAVIAANGVAGRLPTDLVLGSVAACWVDACLFWLVARPSDRSIDWVWTVYSDARDKRDQLRDRQAELSRVLKSLGLAYTRLEHLNDELNHARLVAEEARRSKGEFAASISHELRTPLNLILGFSELMVSTPGAYGAEPLPPAYQADIDAIHRNSHHLAGLIDDVLDLSQIEAGRMGLIRERVNLRDVIDEAVQVMAPWFKNRGLALATAVPDVLPLVRLDRTRIRQILINLLNNAARFTDTGGVRIGAELRGNDVVVSVWDTGVGISPEDLAHVFDEFYQTGSAIQRHAGGSGLGLTLSKHLVELHGGAMWVESAPGVGTAFYFSLPGIDNVASGTLPGEWAIWDRLGRERDSAEPALGLVTTDDSLIRIFQRYVGGYQVLPIADLGQLARLSQEITLRGAIVASASTADSWRVLSGASDAGSPLPIAVCNLPDWRRRTAALGVSEYLTKPILRDQVGEILTRLGKKTRAILVVDDSAEMVRFLSRAIRSHGRQYQIWQATGGQEALALLSERRPDAVFLDLLMPEVDGYGVLTALRADERLRTVPVVVVSAHGADADVPVVDFVGITRSGGMPIDEAMRCLGRCFDTIQPGSEGPGEPAPGATRDAPPAWAESPPPAESAPAPLPAGPNR